MKLVAPLVIDLVIDLIIEYRFGYKYVYLGILDDETRVAVKVIKRYDGQGEHEFLSEVEQNTNAASNC